MVTLKIYTSVLDNESDSVGTMLRNVARKPSVAS
jgi:hypothetical protein